MGQQIATMSKGIPADGGTANMFNPMSPGNRQMQPGLSSDQNMQAPANPGAAMMGNGPTSAAGNPSQSADNARLKILQLFRGY